MFEVTCTDHVQIINVIKFFDVNIYECKSLYAGPSSDERGDMLMWLLLAAAAAAAAAAVSHSVFDSEKPTKKVCMAW